MKDMQLVYLMTICVANYSTTLESVSNKKTRWKIAAGVIKGAWVNSRINNADPLTKRISRTVTDNLTKNWTY